MPVTLVGAVRVEGGAIELALDAQDEVLKLTAKSGTLTVAQARKLRTLLQDGLDAVDRARAQKFLARNRQLEFN